MTANLALFIALAVLQFLDYHTTMTICSLGGKELNPIMRWLFDRLGMDQALVFKGIAVLVFAAVFYQDVMVLGIMVAVFAVVIVWNFSQMPK